MDDRTGRHQGETTNRKIIKRILIALGISAGVVAVTAGQARAGLVLQNHSEPTLRVR